MDNTMILTETMIHDWLQHIQEVNNENGKMIRGGREFYIPFMALPTPIVKKLFGVVDSLALGPRTKYLSLYIYEKYLSNKFWEIYTKHEARPDFQQYQRHLEDVSKILMLRLMSCIQLASKMDSNILGLGVSQVLSTLERIDPETEHTQGGVYLSEVDVFKMINFRVPLVTPLDCVEVLLVALKFDKWPEVRDTAVHVLDMTYLQHQQLFSQVQVTSNYSSAKTKEDKINFMQVESDIVLLSAAVIDCTLEIFHVKGVTRKKILEKLHQLVRIDRDDIDTLGKMIFVMLDLTSNDIDNEESIVT